MLVTRSRLSSPILPYTIAVTDASSKPASVLGTLAYKSDAILAGETWRLWTGHLVHFSWKHALADGIVLTAMARLAEQEK